MKIGLNSGIFPKSWSPAEKLEATVRVGATGLELNIDADQLWTRRLDGATRSRLVQQARAAGVAWTSVCLNAHWIFNLTSPDVRIRDLGSSLLLEAIDLAHDLGAGVVLVPGCDQPESPENAWELFRDGVMQGVARAEQAGVTLALEGVGKPFLFNTEKLMQMVEACGGSRALGIYLDAGNSTRGGMDPGAEIRAACGRAAMVHVKDWDPAGAGPLLLGAGGVDFPTSIAALREIDYSGFVLVELPPDPADSDAVARHSVDYLQNILDVSA